MKRNLGTLALRGAMVCMVLFLTACGTSGSITRPNIAEPNGKYWYVIQSGGGMSPEAMGIFRGRLDERLAKVRAADGAPGAYRAEIRVTNYRLRTTATRILAGIFAGTDDIQSMVQIVEPATGRVLGTMAVDTDNATIMGTSRGFIEAHADEIADFLLAGAGGDASTAPVVPAAQPVPESGQMKWRPRTRN